MNPGQTLGRRFLGVPMTKSGDECTPYYCRLEACKEHSIGQKPIKDNPFYSKKGHLNYTRNNILCDPISLDGCYDGIESQMDVFNEKM